MSSLAASPLRSVFEICYKKYQVPIPQKVREDLNIQKGNKVIFVKNSGGNWILMTIEELNGKMIETYADIDETIKESQKASEAKLEL